MIKFLTPLPTVNISLQKRRTTLQNKLHKFDAPNVNASKENVPIV